MAPMKSRGLRLLTLATSGLALVVSVPGLAQDVASQHLEAPAQKPANDDGLSEIVVTATRRATDLQTTPASVTALGGQDLLDRKISSLVDVVAAVPGFQFGQSYGAASPSIRGIGSNGFVPGTDPRVAFYQNDVYVARPEAQLAGLFDVEQIEVLRGPQGALYGRNATGGAILLRTRSPSLDTGGYAEITAGNFGLVQTDAVITGPLSSVVAARFAVRTVDRNGYGKNIVTGTDVDDARTRSARLSILIQPSSPFELILRGEYHRERDNNYAYHYGGPGNPAVVPRGIALGGISPPPKSYDIANEDDPINRRTFWSIDADASYDAGGATIRSITSYRSIATDNKTQIDGNSLPLANVITHNRSKTFSQDIQLFGSSDALDWIVGANYLKENLDARQDLPLNSILVGGPNVPVIGIRTNGDLSMRSIAAFGRLTWKITDKLSIIAGGRYSDERRHIQDTFGIDFASPLGSNAPFVPIPPFPRNAKKSFNAFTPSASINYTAAPGLFLYAAYSKGFKSGGFSAFDASPAFQPEKIESYEAGIKSEHFDRRFRANISIFHYDYTNLQASFSRGNTTVVENAASAKVDGGELELTALPLPGLELNASVAYLPTAKYTTYITSEPARLALGLQDLAGKRLTQAPKYTFNLSGQYRFAVPSGNIIIRGEFFRSGVTYFTPFNRADSSQPAYSMGNAFLTYERADGWKVSAFVRNIGDKAVYAYAVPASALTGFAVASFIKPPRTYGLTVGYSF